jgi:hypothetical protein
MVVQEVKVRQDAVVRLEKPDVRRLPRVGRYRAALADDCLLQQGAGSGEVPAVADDQGQVVQQAAEDVLSRCLHADFIGKGTVEVAADPVCLLGLGEPLAGAEAVAKRIRALHSVGRNA